MQRVSEDMHAWLSAIGAVCYCTDRVEYLDSHDGVMVKFLLGERLAAECLLASRELTLFDYWGSVQAKRLLETFALQQGLEFHCRQHAA